LSSPLPPPNWQPTLSRLNGTHNCPKRPLGVLFTFFLISTPSTDWNASRLAAHSGQFPNSYLRRSSLFRYYKNCSYPIRDQQYKFIISRRVRQTNEVQINPMAKCRIPGAAMKTGHPPWSGSCSRLMSASLIFSGLSSVISIFSVLVSPRSK